MTTATPINLSDVKQEQVETAVLKNAGGIEGVAQALEANPMPKELLEALQKGIGANAVGRG